MILLTGLTACSSGKANTASSASPSTGQGSSAAQRTVQRLETRPTTLAAIGNPIDKPIPAGKTIDTINCGQSACEIAGQLIAQAAKTLGWTVKDIKTDGTPQEIAAAWQQVISSKPNFAVDEGAPLAEIQTYVSKAAANSTVVLAQGVAAQAGSGLAAVIQNGAATTPEGAAMAAWVVGNAQSSGIAHPSAVYVNLPDFNVLAPIYTQFNKSMSSYCPSCSVSELNIGLTNLQNAGDLVISYLRSHPDVNYVAFSALNIFDAVTPAIRAAGLKVKIIGTTPSDTSMTQLRSGALNAVIAYPYYEAAYAELNVMIRYAAGVNSSNPAPGYQEPIWILTAANAPSGDVFPIVPDVVSQYSKVWGK